MRNRVLWTMILFAGLAPSLAAAPLVSLEGGSTAAGENVGDASEDGLAGQAAQESYRCEVMSIEGKAYRTNRSVDREQLKEGDILEVDDVVEVDPYSWVDVAFDAEWKNVTRLEASTKFTVRSIYPTGVKIVRGAIYARLKALPAGTSFEIETPTAVATVRGSEYRAVVDEDGKTDVSNFSDSPVYVYGLQQAGRDEEATVLRNEQITRVRAISARPEAPRAMTALEKNAGEVVREGLVRRVEHLHQQGRVGKIQNLEGVTKSLRERKGRAAGGKDRDEGGPGGPGGPGGGSGRSDPEDRPDRGADGKFAEVGSGQREDAATRRRPETGLQGPSGLGRPHPMGQREASGEAEAPQGRDLAGPGPREQGSEFGPPQAPGRQGQFVRPRGEAPGGQMQPPFGRRDGPGARKRGEDKPTARGGSKTAPPAPERR